LSMILFVSRYCRRPESMHNNESELNLVYWTLFSLPSMYV
jgi:hypothetical protein